MNVTRHTFRTSRMAQYSPLSYTNLPRLKKKEAVKSFQSVGESASTHLFVLFGNKKTKKVDAVLIKKENIQKLATNWFSAKLTSENYTEAYKYKEQIKHEILDPYSTEKLLTIRQGTVIEQSFQNTPLDSSIQGEVFAASSSGDYFLLVGSFKPDEKFKPPERTTRPFGRAAASSDRYWDKVLGE